MYAQRSVFRDGTHLQSPQNFRGQAELLLSLLRGATKGEPGNSAAQLSEQLSVVMAAAR